jgi:hypothetical protein
MKYLSSSELPTITAIETAIIVYIWFLVFAIILASALVLGNFMLQVREDALYWRKSLNTEFSQRQRSQVQSNGC